MRISWKMSVILGLVLALPSLAFADDESDLREINAAYLQSWLAGDANGVMALFEPDAQISPGQMCPVEGQEDMRAFWFPDDGSVTTIHRFDAEELALVVLDDLGVSTEKTVLEWSYEKGETRIGRVQEGISTTVFRRQADGAWKIRRMMWTDVEVRER